MQATLETSGEDAKTHSKRVEKMRKHTRSEWGRCENYTRNECKIYLFALVFIFQTKSLVNCRLFTFFLSGLVLVLFLGYRGRWLGWHFWTNWKLKTDKSIFTESVRLMEAGVAPVLQWLPSRTSFKRKKNTKKTHVSEKKLQKNTRFPKKTTY